ncbi:MAG: mandelate racemase/muconate lactonizing enzyme family protein [Burkholderiaceae bacterium]
MKIEQAEVHVLRVPFTDGSSGKGLMPTRWTHLDMVLLHLRDADGVGGWGDGFAYSCRTATEAALVDMVLPLVVGQPIDDIDVFCRDLIRKLHLQGRFGITAFAVSAVDLALRDIDARRAGVPLAERVGGIRRRELPAYASLVRYGEPAQVAEFTARAIAEGYQSVKLHEIQRDAIAAGARVAEGIEHLVTDVNCNWSHEQALEMLPAMRDLGLYWVEEPVFPPDDAATLSALEREFGVAIASGENACLREGFAGTVGNIRFVQPSVIKVGGIGEFLGVCDMAEAAGSVVMPHAPYFGPGYWATLHLMAARDCCELFEFLYIDPQAWIDPNMPLPVQGRVPIPEGPGLGFLPDPELLARFAVQPPRVLRPIA